MIREKLANDIVLMAEQMLEQHIKTAAAPAALLKNTLPDEAINAGKNLSRKLLGALGLAGAGAGAALAGNQLGKAYNEYQGLQADRYNAETADMAARRMNRRVKGMAYRQEQRRKNEADADVIKNLVNNANNLSFDNSNQKLDYPIPPEDVFSQNLSDNAYKKTRLDTKIDEALRRKRLAKNSDFALRQGHTDLSDVARAYFNNITSGLSALTGRGVNLGRAVINDAVSMSRDAKDKVLSKLMPTHSVELNNVLPSKSIPINEAVTSISKDKEDELFRALVTRYKRLGLTDEMAINKAQNELDHILR